MAESNPRYLAEIVGTTWLTRTASGALMLHVVVRASGLQDLRLNDLSQYCGGKDGKPCFVPDWVKEFGYEGELAGLHKRPELTGHVVTIQARGDYWNIYTPWGRYALSDAAVEELTPDPYAEADAPVEEEPIEEEEEPDTEPDYLRDEYGDDQDVIPL